VRLTTQYPLLIDELFDEHWFIYLGLKCGLSNRSQGPFEEAVELPANDGDIHRRIYNQWIAANPVAHEVFTGVMENIGLFHRFREMVPQGFKGNHFWQLGLTGNRVELPAELVIARAIQKLLEVKVAIVQFYNECGLLLIPRVADSINPQFSAPSG
jgi:hypothetical protein